MVSATLFLIFWSIVLTGCQTTANEENTLETPQRETKPLTIELDRNEVFQEIDGFGASGAWWAQHVGGWEDREKVRNINRLLFDRETGIGLSVYRYNAGGGGGYNINDPWRRAETYEIAPGEYDWSLDANALDVLRSARDAGVETVVLFANTPPVRMTLSGLSTGGVKGETNIEPQMYEEYAAYLCDIAEYLRDVEKIPVKWISPINEPQWGWKADKGQEGCHYGPDEVLEVTRVFLREMERRNLDMGLSVFESGEWKNSQVYIKKLLEDEEVGPQLSHLAIHSYWSKKGDKARINRFLDKYFPGTELWMSEWTQMEHNRDFGMDSAFVMANTIHDDLTVGKVRSWQYWIAVSKYFYHDGLIYVNETRKDVFETKRLWTLGNYSRFIRPGSVRIAGNSSSDLVKTTAYETAEGDIVAVMINSTTFAYDLQIDFADLDVYSRIEIYETSENRNLERVYGGEEVSGHKLMPKSITTVVLRK